MSKRAEVRGSCLCGACRFVTRVPLTDASLCHCSLCRKGSGSAFGAYASVPRTALVWESSQSLTSYPVTARLTRFFCGICGTGLVSRHAAEPEHTHLHLGCLDDNSVTALEYQQYVGSRAAWVSLPDLPGFDEWPDP